MKSTKTKRKKTRADLQRSNKKNLILIIVLTLVVVYLAINNFIDERKFDSKIEKCEDNLEKNQTKELSFSEKFSGGLVGFIEGVVELKYPFMIKFFIFLGMIYLIQVSLTISGDIIQIILIIGVAIIKLIRWIYKKIKGIEDD